jgi:hypothetical protein
MRMVMSAVGIFAMAGCVKQKGSTESAATRRVDKGKEGAKLVKLFRECTALEGLEYVEKRNEMLRSPLLKDYLGALDKGWKDKAPLPEERALYCYLSAWVNHGETYKRILGQDFYRKRFGGGHGGRFDAGPGMGIALFKECAKDKAPLLLLVESIDKSGEIRYKHDGRTGSLHVLRLLCSGDYKPIIWAGKSYRLDGDDVLRLIEREVPKELRPGEWDKRNLVRVVNKALVRGPIGVDRGITALSSYRIQCAKLLEELGSPSSVSPLVQAAIAEKNKEAIDALRRALGACTKTREGKKALEAVEKKAGSL